MIVKLPTEHHLEFLSLKEGCRGSSESTLVKMSSCWKSHAAAQLFSQTVGPWLQTCIIFTDNGFVLKKVLVLIKDIFGFSNRCGKNNILTK